MKDQNAIKDNATTIIGFAGVLLGLLVNALTTIKFNEFNNTLNNTQYTASIDQYTSIFLKLIFLVATGCLMLSIINGVTTHYELVNKNPKKTNAGELINDPENILKISVKWLVYGLVLITAVIAIMITKSIIYTAIYTGIIAIVMFLDYLKMYNKKKN
jgi:hypothetical protein